MHVVGRKERGRGMSPGGFVSSTTRTTRRIRAEGYHTIKASEREKFWRKNQGRCVVRGPGYRCHGRYAGKGLRKKKRGCAASSTLHQSP